MRSFGNFFKKSKSNSQSRQRKEPIDEPHIFHSPEEYVIYQQEQSGDMWHGVPLSELSKVAQTTYRGKYVKIDNNDFLVFYYSSRSGKTGQAVQCTIDEDGLLKAMSHNYYPGQWRDSSDDFIEKVNQQFTFTV